MLVSSQEINVFLQTEGKGMLVNIVAENLAEECAIVVQKAELISYTTQYLAEIYKQIC